MSKELEIGNQVELQRLTRDWLEVLKGAIAIMTENGFALREIKVSVHPVVVFGAMTPQDKIDPATAQCHRAAMLELRGTALNVYTGQPSMLIKP